MQTLNLSNGKCEDVSVYSIQPKDKHYAFTGKKLILDDIENGKPLELYQIYATEDFTTPSAYKGGIPIRKGTIGGWISLDTKLYYRSWVSKKAFLSGKIAVFDSVIINDSYIVNQIDNQDKTLMIDNSALNGNVKIRTKTLLMIQNSFLETIDDKFIHIDIKPNDYISVIKNSRINSNFTFEGRYLDLKNSKFSNNVTTEDQVVINETNICGYALIKNAILFNVNIQNQFGQKVIIDLSNVKTYKGTPLSDKYADIYDVVPSTANKIENAWFVDGTILSTEDYFSVKCYWDDGKILTYIKSKNEYCLNQPVQQSYQNFINSVEKRDKNKGINSKFFYEKLNNFIQTTRNFSINSSKDMENIKKYEEFADSHKEINTKLYYALVTMSVLCALFLFIILGFFMSCESNNCKTNTIIIEIPANDTIDDDDFTINDSILYSYLKKQKIKHPHIVLAQAKLESANYTSDLYKSNNNLFGMRIPSNRLCVGDKDSGNNYMQYKSWKESVIDYGIYQLSYIDTSSEESYYQWLQKRYAEDSLYIDKVKEIADNIK